MEGLFFLHLNFIKAYFFLISSREIDSKIFSCGWMWGSGEGCGLVGSGRWCSGGVVVVVGVGRFVGCSREDRCRDWRAAHVHTDGVKEPEMETTVHLSPHLTVSPARRRFVPQGGKLHFGAFIKRDARSDRGRKPSRCRSRPADTTGRRGSASTAVFLQDTEFLLVPSCFTEASA